MRSTVTGLAGTLTVTLSVDRADVVQNSPVTFSGGISPSAGSPFNLAWSSLPNGCAGVAPSTVTGGTFSFTCSPSSPGSTTVQLSVSNGTGASGSATVAITVEAPLSVNIVLTPSSLSINTQLSISLQLSGGVAPFSLSWSGLPNGCSGAAPRTESMDGSSSFQCSPSQSGSSQVSVQATDSATPTPEIVTSTPQSLEVVSNGNNGGNGNSGGSGGNNSNGNISIPFLSGLGTLLPLLFIGLLVAFVLLVITAISSLVSAILLARRLPPRSRPAAAGSTRPCPACGKDVASGTKFCPDCGHSMAGSSPGPAAP